MPADPASAPPPPTLTPPPDLAGPLPADAPRWPLAAGPAIVVLLTVALLYVGQDIFVPLALAALLGFMLDPLVTRLRRWGAPRALAVVLVMATTVAVLGGTAVFVGGQVVQLAKNLPTYQTTVQAKLRGLRQLAKGHGPLDDASRLIDVVGGELDAAKHDLDRASATSRAPAPMRVQVEPAPRTALQTLGDWLAPVAGPAGTAGIVAVVLLFILLERNDLRDRLLRLVGGDLHRTTDALGEAAERVSRYLTMQLLVNLSYGVPMALGLWAIGVPGALLWGVLAALLRFVPYVGPVIAAAFPLALALAVDPGWQMLAWTLALVLTLELVSNNLIEPWLYGASTGLSALSIILSAVVWTALWGPAGLILATPLTVCLAVLGRHLPGLRWLDVLLGNAPVFDSPTRLYQRLLAGDVAEAIELASEQAHSDGVAAFYSRSGVPALALAAQDQARPAGVAHRHRVASGMAAVLADLRQDHVPPTPPAASTATTVPLLVVGARWEVDTLAADMLGHALALDGVAHRVLAASAVAADQIQQLDLDGVQVLCLSSFSSTPQAQVRYVARRLKRRAPGLRILVALWDAPPALLSPEAATLMDVDALAGSLDEALARLQRLLQPEAPAGQVPGAPATQPGRADAAWAVEAAADEAARLQALADSGALQPAMRAPLDRAAQRAADVFNAPLAMVSLVDDHSQVWQGAAGLDVHGRDLPRSSPRLLSPCSLVVAGARTVVVDDIHRDPLLADHPLLRQAGVRFYAGAPLRTAGGHVIGTLCLLDHQPRSLSASERRLLEVMADDVVALITTQATRRRRARRQVGATTPAAPSPALPPTADPTGLPPPARPATA